jgi:predicted dehydrogenase
MHRRTFLERATLLSAASASAQPPPRRVKIAFLGLAHSHGPDKLRLALNSPDWECLGVWERDPAAASAARQAGARLLTREQVLASDAEVIAVESEVKPHAGLAIAALEAGKHLHLEKPPADNLRDLLRIRELAEKKRLLVQMGYMWRYHPGMLAIFQAASSGWLGDIYLVRGMMNTFVPASRRPEWALFHGGQMFEQGCHLIDPLIRLLGKPAKVSPFLRHHGNFADNLRDNCAAVFDYPKALGVITTSVLQPDATPHRMFEVQGSNGVALLRPIEGPPRLEISLSQPAGPYHKGRQEVPLPPFSRYVADFADLARCVRQQRPLEPGWNHEVALQETLLAASEML